MEKELVVMGKISPLLGNFNTNTLSQVGHCQELFLQQLILFGLFNALPQFDATKMKKVVIAYQKARLCK